MKQLGLLLISVCLVGSLFGQRKKKKDPYAEYWALEAKKERYDSAMTIANRLFESDKLKEATATYKAAINIWPEGQEAQAKIRDIKILEARRASAANNDSVLEPKPVQEEAAAVPVEKAKPDSIEEVKTPKVEKLKVDTLETKPRPTREKPERDIVREKPVITEKAKPVERKKELPIKTLETKKTPDKPVEPARQLSDSLYQTHEVSKNKEVWEIVSIKNNNKVVYRKVKHVYGAVYFFKDEKAITRDRYLEETEGLLKK